MAEIDFFFAVEDETELIRLVLSSGAWLVPDTDYDTIEYATIHDLGSFLEHRKRTRLFFVLHDEYNRSALEIRPILKNGRERFRIRQKCGGPTVDVFFPSEFTKDDKRILPAGFIGYHSKYWDPGLNENVEPPDGLKRLYRTWVTFIRSSRHRVKMNNRTFWVGRNATRLVEEGELTLAGIEFVP